jgi:hypothetical protein
MNTWPARDVRGHIIFGRDGTTCALYRIVGPTYRHLPQKAKIAWHNRVVAALLNLPGDSMILGVTRPLEARAVAAAMVAGVDLAAHPRWAETARDTLEVLDRASIPTRAHYLAVCLPEPKGINRLAVAKSAAVASFNQALGVPASQVSRRQVRVARDMAADVAKPLADWLGTERVIPAGTDEIEWLYARAALRGLPGEPALSEFASEETVLTPARLAALADVPLVEGGSKDDGVAAHLRRFVRADSERGSSYQTIAAFSHVPPRFAFPDGRGELFAVLEGSELPVDWCMHIHPTANAEARSSMTTQIRRLAGQGAEYARDPAGLPDTIPEAIEDLRAVIARLNASPSSPECRGSILVALSADSPALLEERMTRLRALLEASEYVMPRPVGHQSALWMAMLPGAAPPALLGDYAQFGLLDYFVGLAPFTGTALGDPTGAVLGLNMSGGTPVLFSAATGPNMPKPFGPKSGCIQIAGLLGGGKSLTAKRIVVDTISMGGRVTLVDRTPMGEWVRMAAPLHGDGHTSQVIDLLGADTDVSFDPLEVFRAEPRDAERYGTGFLSMLTGIDPTSPEGVVLGEAVRVVVEEEGRLGDVVEQLELAGSGDSAFALAARAMALRVEAFTRGPLAHLVFGDGAPVDLHADYTVFKATNLSLPRAEALRDRRQLTAEHIFNQALLYLVTAVARHVAFSERDRFHLVVQDEGYVMTSTPQGLELLEILLRDGRKHAAALMFISHSPDDLPVELQRLVRIRLLFRMDDEAAIEGLRWMGLEPSAENRALIAESARRVGQCLFRDLEGRVGMLQVLPFATPELAAAADTSLTNAKAEARAATQGLRRRRAPVAV